MKKITFLADASNAHMERWIAALQDAYEIQIVTQTINPKLDAVVKQVVYALNPSRVFLLRQLKMIWQIYKVKKQITAFAPDIIHVHYALPHPIIRALPENVPMITSLWGSDIVPLPEHAFKDKNFEYLRKYFRRSKKITVTSTFLLNVFHKLFHEEFSAPVVVPFGVDTSLFRPQPKEDKKPVIVGFARSFLKHYGFLDLLFACEPLMKEGLVTLRVAGEGKEKNLYKYEVTKHGLQKYVTFLGRISPVFKMPDFYHSIDIFASPSHRESFGVSALEASACGVPVVATRVGGLPETVQDNVTGILYMPHEIEQLREAIRRLATDHELRKKMGEVGRKKVKDEYEWHKNVSQMKALYEEIT